MSTIFKILKVLAWIIVALTLVIVIAFCGTRWWFVNDVSDIQGNWKTEGSDAVFPITDTSLKLTDDVTYTYDIDTLSKTITTHLGNIQGKSHYRFSADRKTLYLQDANYDWLQSVNEDIKYFIASMMNEKVITSSNILILYKIS